MDFKSLLSEIRKNGHPDAKAGKVMMDSEIVREIELAGVSVREPTIYRLRAGTLSNPSFRLGNAILMLYRNSVEGHSGSPSIDPSMIGEQVP